MSGEIQQLIPQCYAERYGGPHPPADLGVREQPRPVLKVMFVFGTRPEAIKFAPLIKAFAKEPTFSTKICVTAQHRELLDQVLEFFEITPDYDLDVMTPNQTLFDITHRALTGLRDAMEDFQPDNVLVHGDTTTAMVGALAAFYLKADVSHVEAGLRSNDLASPFPEEGNRRLVSQLARFHFTHSAMATEHLKRIHITQNVYQVGNTGIDALRLGLEMLRSRGEDKYEAHFRGLDLGKRILLVTSHRRESFGQPLVNICQAIRDVATKFQDVEVVYTVHPNPNVRRVPGEILRDIPNIKLMEPLSYPHFIWLMSKAYLVITDSGGIQEEAPALGKPLLILRDVTDRMEGVLAGKAMLVGTGYDKIRMETERLLLDKAHYARMADAVIPYGDGTASQQILDAVKAAYSTKNDDASSFSTATTLSEISLANKV